MQLKRTTQGLLLALPMLVLTACSSTSQTEVDSEVVDSSVDSNQSGAQTGSLEGGFDFANGNGGTTGGVQIGGLTETLSPEETLRQKYDELRKEQIIYFDFDRSDINSKYAELLQAHAAYLVASPNVRVLVEGHADERGTPEYNIALAERRAQSVQRYLQGLGVLMSQITMVSYGEEKPLDSSATEAAHAKNRRAVLVY